MKNMKMRLLAVALLALATLGFAALGTQEQAFAAPCCTWCDDGLSNCENGCGGDPACLAACDAQWARCFRICNSGC